MRSPRNSALRAALDGTVATVPLSSERGREAGTDPDNRASSGAGASKAGQRRLLARATRKSGTPCTLGAPAVGKYNRAVAYAGDVIENPTTGQRLTFLATARDTAGEVLRAEGAFPPGGFAGVEHVHPHQDEHFEVLAGRAAFQVEGREHVLGAGETIDVPAGTKHTFANAGDEEMRVLFEFRPALDCTDLFYELYFGFAQEGRVNAKAMPGLLDVAIAWPLVSDHAVLARPPAWVQHLTFRLLTPVARLLRRQLPNCERRRAET
jgi:quercetin dioxygenase-like cupin family protein